MGSELRFFCRIIGCLAKFDALKGVCEDNHLSFDTVYLGKEFTDVQENFFATIFWVVQADSNVDWNICSLCGRENLKEK
jgi:hypothetical protein